MFFLFFSTSLLLLLFTLFILFHLSLSSSILLWFALLQLFPTLHHSSSLILDFTSFFPFSLLYYQSYFLCCRAIFPCHRCTPSLEQWTKWLVQDIQYQKINPPMTIVMLKYIKCYISALNNSSRFFILNWNVKAKHISLCAPHVSEPIVFHAVIKNYYSNPMEPSLFCVYWLQPCKVGISVIHFFGDNVMTRSDTATQTALCLCLILMGR